MPRKQHMIRLSVEDRAKLQQMVRHGHQEAWALQRARIVLKADAATAGPALTDDAVAEAVGVSTRTVARVRADWCTRKWGTLRRRPRAPEANPPTFDAAQQSRIVAVACSTPPPGFARWTLRLLAKHLVELEIVDTISHESVRMVLKKTRSSPGVARAS